MVKEGTKWGSADGKVFHVIHRVEVDGKIWIHYEQDNCKECREFSCYEESFLLRFTQLPE
jgi:hypothetical protein